MELIKFADDIKLAGKANRFEIKKEFDRFEHCALTNKMKINREKSEILHQMQRYRIVGTWLNSSICKSDLGVLADNHSNMS